MTALNYSRLYYFYKVAELGTQAAAARELGVSQSTISEQIKRLEYELDTVLFKRRGQSMALTDEGRKAQEHAKVIFGAGERLLQELGVSSAPRMALEIGVAATVSRSLTAELFLPLFDNEAIRPRVSVADYGTLFPRLGSGELHLLLSETEPRGGNAQNIASVVARHVHLVLVASPELAAQIEENDDLSGKPWVHFTTHSGFRWVVDAHLRSANVEPQIVAESDDLELIRLAAIRGDGVAALPKSYVAGDIRERRLVRVADVQEPIPLFLSYADDTVSEYVRDAVSLITSESNSDKAEEE